MRKMDLFDIQRYRLLRRPCQPQNRSISHPTTGFSDRLLVRVLFPVITAGFGVEYWWCLVISLFFLPQPSWLRFSYGSATVLYPDDLYTIISQACNKKGTIYITLKCEDLAKEFNLRVQRMQLKEGEAGRHETIVRASM